MAVRDGLAEKRKILERRKPGEAGFRSLDRSEASRKATWDYSMIGERNIMGDTNSRKEKMKSICYKPGQCGGCPVQAAK